MRRLFALLLIALPALAHAQSLRIGVAALANSADPQFYNLAPNNTLAANVFDALTRRGPDASLQPNLALNWQPVGDTIWEFRLRPGVTWQDGTAFTADDVAFSYARAPTVPNSPSSFAGMLRAITRVEVVDPLTLRFHTQRPAPNLPGDLAFVSIVSRHAGDGAASADYDSGKAAIGTGAYRLVRYVKGDRAVLARNDTWWGGQAQWAEVTFRAIPNQASRTAALLAGDVDMIDSIGVNDLPTLRADSRTAVWEAPGLRVLFLGLDWTRTGPQPDITDAAGQVIPRNPLADKRVRQALSLAIDRQALVDRVMQGAGTPTGQWMPAGTPGYLPDMPAPRADPTAARRLLTEAGFPDGFHLVFHAPNDRYPNDAAQAQAIAQMWTRAGVATRLEVQPGAVYAPPGIRHEYAVGLWSWSNTTAEAGYALLNVLGTQDGSRGVSNVGGYSNPKLDALVEQALATLGKPKRDALLQDAVRMAVDDVASITLFHLRNAWATRKGLLYQARADDLTLANQVTPAP